MTELRRLLDESEDDLSLALLRAARDETPPAGAVRQTAAALGVGVLGAAALATKPVAAELGRVSAVTVVGAKAAHVGVSTAVLFKYIGAGMVGGFLAMAAVDRGLSSTSAAPPPAALPAAPAAPAIVVAEHSAARSGSAPAGTVVADAEPVAAPQRSTALRRRIVSEEAPSPVAEPAVEAPVSIAPTPTVAPRPGPASLAAELARLDAARNALARGNAESALEELDRYWQVRASGALDHEAGLLRVQALLKAGDRAGAARLASELLQRYPRGGHAEALRAIAEGR